MDLLIPPPPSLGNHAIELVNAGARVGEDDRERWLFRGLTLSLKPAQCTGIVGRNGVGKTTLLRICLGERPADLFELLDPIGSRHREGRRPVHATEVAQHAYRVTDEDVAALKQAGYSEDAIFEITASTAVGVALMRLQRGMRALEDSAS